jgi:hypothetical protein
MKLRPTKRLLAWCVPLFCALAYVGYGVVEPHSSPGHAIFQIAYSLPATRPAFLRFYQWSLREFNGGYLPGAIDEFLVTRLWSSPGTREWQAIIDFQIAQSSSRWGDSFSRVHDDLKQQIIGDIFHRLDTFPPRHAAEALLLVECMRRDDTLHKGGFSNLNLWTNDGTTATYHPERLATLKDSFRRWWADGVAWPANKNQDPLKGTNIAIYHGP